MNIANRLTVSRILLVPFFTAALVYYSPERILLYWASIIIFMVACLTDALDGYWAKRMNQKTLLGSYLDPIADKLLLLSGYLCLGFIDHLPEAMKVPAWLTILVISRDLVILIGSTLIFVITGSLKAKPLYVGKITTFLQMLTLLAALLMIPELLRDILFGVASVLTAVSGLMYVRMGGQMLQENGK